jgi:hypothetical protein
MLGVEIAGQMGELPKDISSANGETKSKAGTLLLVLAKRVRSVHGALPLLEYYAAVYLAGELRFNVQHEGLFTSHHHDQNINAGVI